MERAAADRAAKEVARRMGFSAEPALLRFASNSLYRVEGAVLRVSPMEASREYLSQQLRFALFLVSSGFPTSLPLREEPEEADGLLVSRWTFIGGKSAEETPGRKMGQLLRYFHDASDSYTGELPQWDWKNGAGFRVSEQLENNEYLSRDDLRLLLERQEEIIEEARNTRFALPEGVIHGDFNASNVIDSGKELHLIDFDRTCRGPREWDLVLPICSERFYGNIQSRDVCLGYGWRPEDFAGAEALIRLKCIFSMAWLSSQEKSQWKEQETKRRMQYWRNPEGQWEKWQGPPRSS